MALIMWLYHYCGSNAASEIVVFRSSFHKGINKLVVGVGGSFVDAGKRDLWVSEALLYAKYVITPPRRGVLMNYQRQQLID